MNEKPVILAVDDTPDALALLDKILTQAGYQVRAADSGELALAAAVMRPPDLILLDVRMDGMDGIAVCQRLKAHPATKHIPIILLSAYAEVVEWVMGLEAGAADYITKPFRSEELLTRVKTHLSLVNALKNERERLLELQRVSTELAEAQAELRKINEQLVESAKLVALGELVAGVTHELNNPLFLIQGFAARLHEKLTAAASPPQEQVEALDEIERNVVRMTEVVRHFRNFARRADDEFFPCDINEVIRNSFVLFKEQLRLSSVMVEFDLDADLPPLRGNHNRLEQVFVNLIGNARDAIESGGAGFGTINVASRADHGRILIRFSDSGPGISEAAAGRIFDSFFTTKPAGKGTGLGLPICRKILQEHNGEIVLDSKAGQGCAFKITLPAA